MMIPNPGMDPNNQRLFLLETNLPPCSNSKNHGKKIVYDRLECIIGDRQVIPDYQFGLRNKHATIEQMHRIYFRHIYGTELSQ